MLYLLRTFRRLWVVKVEGMGSLFLLLRFLIDVMMNVYYSCFFLK